MLPLGPSTSINALSKPTENKPIFLDEFIHIQVGDAWIGLPNDPTKLHSKSTVQDLYQYIEEQKLELLIGWDDYGTFKQDKHTILFDQQLYLPKTLLIDIIKKGTPCNLSVDFAALAAEYLQCQEAHILTELQDNAWKVMPQYNWINNSHQNILVKKVFTYENDNDFHPWGAGIELATKEFLSKRPHMPQLVRFHHLPQGDQGVPSQNPRTPMVKAVIENSNYIHDIVFSSKVPKEWIVLAQYLHGRKTNQQVTSVLDKLPEEVIRIILGFLGPSNFFPLFQRIQIQISNKNNRLIPSPQLPTTESSTFDKTMPILVRHKSFTLMIELNTYFRIGLLDQKTCRNLENNLFKWNPSNMEDLHLHSVLPRLEFTEDGDIIFYCPTEKDYQMLTQALTQAGHIDGAHTRQLEYVCGEPCGDPIRIFDEFNEPWSFHSTLAVPITRLSEVNRYLKDSLGLSKLGGMIDLFDEHNVSPSFRFFEKGINEIEERVQNTSHIAELKQAKKDAKRFVFNFFPLVTRLETARQFLQYLNNKKNSGNFFLMAKTSSVKNVIKRVTSQLHSNPGHVEPIQYRKNDCTSGAFAKIYKFVSKYRFDLG